MSRNKKLALTLGVLLIAVACAPLPAVDAANLPQAQPAHPLAAKIGESIALHGTYQGWAQCESSSGATRSDWVLIYEVDQAKQCVFVSGGLPQGVVPAPATASIGMPVWVKGKVMRSATDKPYLALE